MRRRRSRFEWLEPRNLLAAAAGEDVVDLSALPQLDFEPVIEGRDWFIARGEGTANDDVIDRFAVTADADTTLQVYFDTFHARSVGLGVKLFDASGEQLGSDSLYSNNHESTQFMLGETGDYYFEVDELSSGPPNGAPFDFQLRVLKGSVAFEPTVGLSIEQEGQIVTSVGGVITSSGPAYDVDTYTLGSLGVGTTVDVQSHVPTFGTVAPIVELFTSFGTVDDLDPAPGRLQAIVPTSGKYGIRIRHETVFEGSRYEVASSNRWSTADEEARAAGGHLVSINSEPEAKLVASLSVNPWLGLQRKPGHSIESLTWTSGEPLSYTNWREGEPSESGPAAIDFATGQWQLLGDFDNRPVIAELPRSQDDPVSSVSGADGLYLIDIDVQDTVVPRVASIQGLPVDGVSSEQLIHEFRINLSENIREPESLSDIVELREAGPDGEFLTDDDTLIPTTVSIFGKSALGVDVTHGPLANGLYRVEVSNSVTDLSGNSLFDGQGYSRTFRSAAVTDDHIFEGTDNDTLETATPLPLTADTNGTGLSHTPRAGLGVMDKFSDADFWQFEAAAGSTVSATLGLRLEPITVSLIDSNGTELAVSNGFTLPKEIDATVLPEAGTYYIRIDSGTVPAPDYELRLVLSDRTAIESRSYQSGSSFINRDVFEYDAPSNPRAARIAGTLLGERADEQDAFNLGRLERGSTVQLSTSRPEWSTLTPIVELYGAVVGRVLDNDDSPSTFSAELLQTDLYFAVVREAVGGGPNGQYIVEAIVSDAVAPTVVDVIGLPKAAVPGKKIIGSFSLKFSEDVVLGDEPLIDLRDSGPDGLFDTDDDIIYSVDLAFGQMESEVEATVTDGPLANGTYRLSLLPALTDRSGNELGAGAGFVRDFEISAFGDEFVFEGFDNGEMEKATILPLQSDSNGTGLLRSARDGIGIIADNEDNDWWQFDALENDVTRVWLNYDEWLDIQVFDANGDTVDSTSAGSPSTTRMQYFTAPQDGTYFIRVYPTRLVEFQEQSYTLRVDAARGFIFEEKDRLNDHFTGHAERISFTPSQTVAETLAGKIGGTLLANDRDLIELGRLDEDVRIGVTISKPEWSDANPIIELHKNADDLVEEFTLESGVLLTATPELAKYWLVVRAPDDNVGTGINSQYVLDISLSSIIGLDVVGYQGVPADGGETDRLIAQFTLNVSRLLDESSVNESEVELVHAGNDAEFDTADDRLIPMRISVPAVNSFTTDFRQLHLATADGVGVLTAGHYRLTLPASIRSQYGQPMGLGEGVATTFTILPLPDAYVLEPDDNDTRNRAARLTPHPDGSQWLTPGTGAIQEDDDDDWWRFEAKAGDYVTLWLPSRDEETFVAVRLQDESGETLFPVVSHGRFDLFRAFNQFLIPADGTYYATVGQSQSFLPIDRLYELWIHISPASDETSAIDTGSLGYPAFVPAVTGRTAVIADNLPHATPGFRDTTTYRLNDLAPGTGFRAEFRVPHWVDQDPPMEFVNDDYAPTAQERFFNVLRDTILFDVEHRLVFTHPAERDSIPPGVGPKLDFALEIELIDPVPPEVVSANLEPADEFTQVPPAYLDLQFDRPVTATNLRDGLTLTRNGEVIDPALIAIRNLGNGLVRLDNLPAVASQDGKYLLVADLTSIKSQSTNALGAGETSTRWTLDRSTPTAAIEIDRDGAAYQLRVSTQESENGSGVTGVSLFAIDEGQLRHLQSTSDPALTHEYTDESEATEPMFFAVAEDLAGNRSSVDIPVSSFERITVDVSLSEVAGVKLPSRIVVDQSTELQFTGGWNVLPRVRVDDRWVHRIKAPTSAVIEVEGPHHDQNPVLRHDVDRSGQVTAMDALRLINYLAYHDPTAVEPLSDLLTDYFDVSGDRKITSLDALQVINRLSIIAAGRAVAEAERVPEGPLQRDLGRRFATERRSPIDTSLQQEAADTSTRIELPQYTLSWQSDVSPATVEGDLSSVSEPGESEGRALGDEAIRDAIGFQILSLPQTS